MPDAKYTWHQKNVGKSVWCHTETGKLYYEYHMDRYSIHPFAIERIQLWISVDRELCWAIQMIDINYISIQTHRNAPNGFLLLVAEFIWRRICCYHQPHIWSFTLKPILHIIVYYSRSSLKISGWEICVQLKAGDLFSNSMVRTCGGAVRNILNGFIQTRSRHLSKSMFLLTSYREVWPPPCSFQCHLLPFRQPLSNSPYHVSAIHHKIHVSAGKGRPIFVLL